MNPVRAPAGPDRGPTTTRKRVFLYGMLPAPDRGLAWGAILVAAGLVVYWIAVGRIVEARWIAWPVSLLVGAEIVTDLAMCCSVVVNQEALDVRWLFRRRRITYAGLSLARTANGLLFSQQKHPTLRVRVPWWHPRGPRLLGELEDAVASKLNGSALP
jgi:hypothetical protein